MRRRVEPDRKQGGGALRDLEREPHSRGAWALPDVHADRALPGGLRDIQSVRVPRPLPRHFTILQAALRVTHHRLSYLDSGAPGEALLAAESHGPGCERQRSRGYV